MPDLEITFDEVRKQNIEQLKILNRAIFPIKYQDRIYQDILASGGVSQLGSSLLDKCLLEAKQDDNIKEAYLHVQTNNEEAIRFYRLFNFAVGETISNYYRKLDPPDAVVLRRMLVTES